MSEIEGFYLLASDRESDSNKQSIAVLIETRDLENGITRGFVAHQTAHFDSFDSFPPKEWLKHVFETATPLKVATPAANAPFLRMYSCNDLSREINNIIGECGDPVLRTDDGSRPDDWTSTVHASTGMNVSGQDVSAPRFVEWLRYVKYKYDQLLRDVTSYLQSVAATGGSMPDASVVVYALSQTDPRHSFDLISPLDLTPAWWKIFPNLTGEYSFAKDDTELHLKKHERATVLSSNLQSLPLSSREVQCFVAHFQGTDDSQYFDCEMMPYGNALPNTNERTQLGLRLDELKRSEANNPLLDIYACGNLSAKISAIIALCEEPILSTKNQLPNTLRQFRSSSGDPLIPNLSGSLSQALGRYMTYVKTNYCRTLRLLVPAVASSPANEDPVSVDIFRLQLPSENWTSFQRIINDRTGRYTLVGSGGRPPIFHPTPEGAQNAG